MRELLFLFLLVSMEDGVIGFLPIPTSTTPSSPSSLNSFDPNLVTTTFSLDPNSYLDGTMKLFTDPAWQQKFVNADSISASKDMASFSALASVGDLSAQTIESTEKEKTIAIDRLKRFALFGLLDGFINHVWYHYIDQIITGNTLIDIIEKVVCDIFLYGPVWYVYYLCVMTLLEKKGVEMVIPTIKERWLDLTVRSTGFYLPLAIVMYTMIPLESRVLVLSFCNIIYVTGLSLWQNSNEKLMN